MKYRNILFLVMVILLFKNCSWPPGTDPTTDEQKKRHAFLNTIPGKYSLVSYEKNGVSIIDSFGKFDISKIEYEFTLRWEDKEYVTYTGFIDSKMFTAGDSSFYVSGDWSNYNSSDKTISLGFWVIPSDSVGLKSPSQFICDYAKWNLSTPSNQLVFEQNEHPQFKIIFVRQ